MKLYERQALFVRNVCKLIEYIFSQGYSCTFGETYRTPQQAEIYEKQGKGIKNSLHCKRLAIDLNLFSPQGDYLMGSESHRKFGEYWTSLHKDNQWGGSFKRVDGNHYQMNL
jgi:hypothetical protein